MAKLRYPQVELLYNFFRQTAETSNANLIQNVDYLLASLKQDNSKLFGSVQQNKDMTLQSLN